MKKNSKITLAVLIAGVILSLAARVFVISAHTDMKTGFLYHGDELLCNILYYGIVVIAAVAAIFTAKYDEENGAFGECTAKCFTGTKAVVIGFLTLIAGLFAVYEGFTETRAITRNMFLVIINFLFGAGLIALAFAILFKKEITAGLGFSYSLVGLYCVGRGIYCFMSRMAIATVPEYLIECLSLIGMSVFFVLLGRFLSGNETKNTSKALCFWGVGTSALTLSSALGTIIASIFAPEPVRSRIVMTSYAAESFRQASEGFEPYQMVYTPWVNVFLGLLTAAVLVMMFISSPKSDNSETESN